MRRTTASAILSDQNLDDGLGSDLIAWLADHNPLLAQRAFLLTGEDAVDDCPDFLKSRIIRKPFQMSQLLLRLDQLLRPSPEGNS